MNYLVTGGAGFIGSHLVNTLLERDDDVVILDDLSTGAVRNIGRILDHPRLSFREGSILDEGLVRSLVQDADVVVHLAAAVGVNLIIAQPLESLLNNIRGTEIVLEACADYNRKVLISSTSEIYGKNGAEALREDSDRILGSPFVSRWSYSTAKAVDEILAYNYWRERRTPTVVVRLFNCVGPRQTGEYGMVIPRLVRQALTGDEVTVFGDGEQRRSFCHVSDTVAAITALLSHPKAIGDVFNIGAPQELSINELASRVIRLVGSDSKLVHIPYDEAYESGFEDMQRRFPDISKVSRLTGWNPSRSLDDILGDVVEFERASMISGQTG